VSARVYAIQGRNGGWFVEQRRPDEGSGTWGHPIGPVGPRWLAVEVSNALNDAYEAGKADGSSDTVTRLTREPNAVPWHDRPSPPCPDCSRPDPHTHVAYPGKYVTEDRDRIAGIAYGADPTDPKPPPPPQRPRSPVPVRSTWGVSVCPGAAGP
jgi:hypothetical protein